MLYLPQPLLPILDRDLGTQPAVTGLLITAALLGFAVAGLLHGGDPARTLRRAMWLTVAGSIVSALSPSIWVMLPARAAAGLGIGLMVAGGLAEVPRRLPPAVAGRVTGAMISGTAIGGLLGRAAGYIGLFVSWRWAFLVGGIGTLAIVSLSLRALGPPATLEARPPATGRAPLSLLLAGAFILFVSVGFFDLLPYRVVSPAVGLPPQVGDLVYVTFVLAAVLGVVGGRAVDRFGTRPVIVVTAIVEVPLMLAGLLPGLAPLTVAATAAITGTVVLHVAHSGWAATYGRAAVGRYLAGYYVGGAAAAPVCAYGFQVAGWSGVILPCLAVTVVVLLLAVTRQQPDRAQGQETESGIAPAGGAG